MISRLVKTIISHSPGPIVNCPDVTVPHCRSIPILPCLSLVNSSATKKKQNKKTKKLVVLGGSGAKNKDVDKKLMHMRTIPCDYASVSRWVHGTKIHITMPYKFLSKKTTSSGGKRVPIYISELHLYIYAYALFLVISNAKKSFLFVARLVSPSRKFLYRSLLLYIKKCFAVIKNDTEITKSEKSN